MTDAPEKMTFREAQSHIDPNLVASIIRAAQVEFYGVYPDSTLSLAVGPTQAILGLAVARGMICADLPPTVPEVRDLVELLREARDDLAAHVDAEWPDDLCERYPGYKRKRERDMDLCHRIDAALAKLTEGGDE